MSRWRDRILAGVAGWVLTGSLTPSISYTNTPYGQALVITGNASSGNCPITNSYTDGNGNNDGCAGAQATGSFQATNFFNGYTNGTGYPAAGSCSVSDPGSGGANRCRPPWNVAGVDYPVGYSTSITLATPTQGALSATCPGATLSGSSLTISGSSNCTINGYDFSKISNCVAITITNSATVTFTNNNVVTSACTSFGVAMSLNGNGTYNINYNQFTGSGYPVNNGGPGGLINSAQGATWNATLNYNAFISTSQSVIQLNSNAVAENHYNYAVNLGCCGNHGDYNISTQTSGTQTFNMSFNTLFGLHATATTECYVSTGGAGGITGYCNNQTMIANPGGGVTVSYMIESSNGVIGNWQANNNYLDINGSFGYYSTNTAGQSVIGTIVCTGNINISTGALATGTFTGASCT